MQEQKAQVKQRSAHAQDTEVPQGDEQALAASEEAEDVLDDIERALNEEEEARALKKPDYAEWLAQHEEVEVDWLEEQSFMGCVC
jgi:phage terminase small subunit